MARSSPGRRSPKGSNVYTGFTGPTNFGSGDVTGGSGSGAIAGIFGDRDQLILPTGYVSGTPLSETSTYTNETFNSLGVTPGTYVWKWGSGANADSFTLRIGAVPVSEPTGLSLLALPLGLLTLCAARRGRLTRTG